MANKDFLSQFSGENAKPESFKEEVRIPVQNNKKVNPLAIIIPAIVLVIAAIVLVVIFVLPHIEVADFTGQTKADVAAWVKQQGIETSGIVFKEEYNFDVKEGAIISQDPVGGKVTKKAKMTFVLSLGADPDEKVSLPDIANMTREEIEKWISKNKCSAVKFTTVYDDNVPSGSVVKYDLSGDESSFTRGTTLKITISKGEKPADKITLEDFSGKSYEYVEAWAKAKKVTVTKTTKYSDTIAKDCVISQSVASGKTLEENDKFEVVVSLGKAVTMPNLYEWTENEISRWCNKNGLILGTVQYLYSDEGEGECIDQSPKEGKIAVSGDYIDITISKGNPVLVSFVGNDFDTLKEKINALNKDGANLDVQVSYQIDESAPGTVISNTTNVDCGDTVYVVVSKGKNILLSDSSWDSIVLDPSSVSESEIRTLCENEKVNIVISYQASETVDVGHVISIARSDGKELKSNSYIPECESIVVVICDK